MLVKYNGIQLPNLPADLSVEEYPYIFIRKNKDTGYYDLVCGTQKYYYLSSSSKLYIDSGSQKWYRVAINTAFDDNTEWEFYKTIQGSDFWGINSLGVLIWSLFDIPSGSSTSTTVYYAGTEIEYPDIKKYLVRDNDTIYTVTEGALAEVTGELNSNLFIDNGIDTIPDGALLMTLATPEVLCWTNTDTVPTLTATVTGTPQPQTIISDKIYLTDKSITGIESALATCEGDLVIAVSFDDKQTWKAWNGEQWATLSDDNTGMSKATLEAITFEQWNELYTGATGFYVRVSLLDTTQSVEKIVFDFSN